MLLDFQFAFFYSAKTYKMAIRTKELTKLENEKDQRIKIGIVDAASASVVGGFVKRDG